MKNANNKLSNWYHEHFKLNKEHFKSYNEYTLTKLKYSWMKKLIYAIMGGVFVALGYTGTLIVMAYGDNSAIFKFLGATLFPVGLLLCIFLGGTLFTSNCMGFISVLYKDVKIRHFWYDLAMVLFGNGLGCFIVALIVWGSGTFGGVAGVPINETGESIINVAMLKIDSHHGHDWWNNILSGILCNVIVVGTTMLNLNTKNKVVSMFIIFVLLVVFVVSGFQHVVANFYVFSISGLISLGATDASNMFSSAQAGEIFYINLIPSAIGNLIGGGLMTGAYLLAYSYRSTKKQEQLKKDTKIEVKECCGNCDDEH
ncbi:MAG: formate/nitrite transporter family protein, partial [Mycoplasma sp.]